MSRPPELIPYDRTVHADVALDLWTSAGTDWVLTPGSLRGWTDGVVAVTEDGLPIGFLAFSSAGAIEIVVVASEYVRSGVGSALLSSATRQLADVGVTSLSTSDGAHAIWPGVPDDLRGATRLFDRAGWRIDHHTDDLTQDLASYVTPEDVFDGSRAAGLTIAVEPAGDALLDFERVEFPSWFPYYAATIDDSLVARDRAGAVVGAALLGGPGVASPFTPMLGERAATIGCVGVAAAQHGHGIGTALVAHGSEILRDRGARVCHISWTTRASFYESLGYVRWRSYRMYRRP